MNISKIQKKYLKYKQKYINLKEIIGGGIEASYTISGNKLTLKYKLKGTEREIKYTIKEELGQGTFGIVSLIENDDDTMNKYIFKKSKKDFSRDSYNEGINSNMLTGILDDMLVLFQGTIESDFLISRYNGKDLVKEFRCESQKIKEKYATTTIQLLELLHKINSNDIFHNDIKLANITINDNDKVYLIDFGLLSTQKSKLGTLLSMSYRSVIDLLEQSDLKKYRTIHLHLKSFLKYTDIFAFFYCCINLLFLSNDQFSLSDLFRNLNISGFNPISMYNLFLLYYFILPESKKNITTDNIYDVLLPTSLYAKCIFGNFIDDNTNLFRFMAFIYNNIELHLRLNKTQQTWYIDFLKIMSTCFLPDFDYNNFKPIFNGIVLNFSQLS